MATQATQVQEWRSRIVRLQDALNDCYELVEDYSSLGGQEWLEENASAPNGTGLIDGHGDLTVGEMVAMVVSIGAIKTAVEGGFHDTNLIKARP